MSASPRSPNLPSPSATDHNIAGSEPRPLQQASPRLVLQPYEPDEDEADPYIESTDEQLVAPPNFNPFFTVIEDSVSGEHYHPSVHYIFSDDDQEIMTAAAIRELGYDDAVDAPREDDRSDATITLLPPVRPGVQERYLVLDVGNDGRTVTDVQSMSKDWQVVETAVTPAPTWAADTDADDGALMLKISGMDVALEPSERLNGSTLFRDARHQATGNTLAALDALAEKFEKELGAVNKLLGQSQITNQSSTIRARGGSIGTEQT